MIRSRKHRFALLAIAAILAASATAETASACSHPGKRQFDDLKQADAVFRARVVEFEKGSGSDLSRTSFEVEVDTVYAGRIGNRVELSITRGMFRSPIRWKESSPKDLIVAANRIDNSSASLAPRTKENAEARLPRYRVMKRSCSPALWFLYAKHVETRIRLFFALEGDSDAAAADRILRKYFRFGRFNQSNSQLVEALEGVETAMRRLDRDGDGISIDDIELVANGRVRYGISLVDRPNRDVGSRWSRLRTQQIRNELQHAMVLFDRDGDRVLTVGEMKTAATAAFRRYDKNGNDVLDDYESASAR